ncbi:MAG: ACP S-malonyltransferase, partial [Thermoleophilaceae bacterium]|nr:ACP S-malonyltransferase [Thermoleophilaceae bacterium]
MGKAALLFPGQGSQAVGMGRALAQAHPVAGDAFAEADAVLGFPLSALLFEGPPDELTRTANAQPALLAHGVAAARVLVELGARPRIAAGHSLGEFSALVVAGALSFESALRAVRRRGELMAAAGEARPGTMAAVLGLDDAAVAALCAEASAGREVVVPANLNAPRQVVVSGDVAAVARAGELARARGAKRVLPLQVSGAFHSPLMAPVAEGLRAALEGVPVEDARFPVVSNVTAEPVVEAGEIRRLLVAQVTSPVRWNESMARMVKLGYADFVECGPGRVLTGLARRVPGVRSALAVGEPGDVEAALAEGAA